MDSLASQSPLPLDRAVSRYTFKGHKSYREKKPGCINIYTFMSDKSESVYSSYGEMNPGKTFS